MGASKTDWYTEPMAEPSKRVLLNDLPLSQEEFERVAQGLVPEAMEDKWFLYFEDGKLYCHRSWNGECIYVVDIVPTGQGYRAESFLTLAARTLENADRAIVGALITFLAGDHVREQKYTMQYEALAGNIGPHADAEALRLYHTFGLQLLAGLKNCPVEEPDAAENLEASQETQAICFSEAIRSGLYGVCVGDALGVPAEFRSGEDLERSPIESMVGGGVHGQPPGTWSDDSSMTLCLADSIGETGGIHTHDIMARFLRWFRDGAYTPWGVCFDCGHTTAQALLRCESGTEPALCGGNKLNDNGNGSLMRILPLAYPLYKEYGANPTSSTKAMELIHKVSGLTHRHALAQSACGIYVCIAAKLLDARWKTQTIRRLRKMQTSALPYQRNYTEKKLLNCAIRDGVREALAWYRSHGKFGRVDAWWKRLLELEQLRDTARSDVRCGGYVVESLEAALWCLLNTDNYADCVMTAVNLGHDADTTAAIAGGLAGLAYGYDAIPGAWLESLQGKQTIDMCCERLNARFQTIAEER